MEEAGSIILNLKNQYRTINNLSGIGLKFDNVSSDDITLKLLKTLSLSWLIMSIKNTCY